jgi:hypothetical protein
MRLLNTFSTGLANLFTPKMQTLPKVQCDGRTLATVLNNMPFGYLEQNSEYDKANHLALALGNLCPHLASNQFN